MMPRSPVPGEAPLDRRALRRMVVVQNVALGTLSDEIHLDAVIDTGAAVCVVPPVFAHALGSHYGNRLEGRSMLSAAARFRWTYTSSNG